MENCLIYMTAETVEQARDIGRKLVENRLAACVNILDGSTSMYWWEGSVEEGRETVLIAKTRADRVAELTEKVKQWHSYDCPCVVSIPIQGGNADFLNWIQSETG